MPTPFYHLSIAQTLLEDARIDGSIRDFLATNKNAFYLGNTAPDVQSLMEIPRAGTHFFEVPPEPGPQPWELLFTQYPALADSTMLAPAHAAFIAGYVCHLAADIRWIHALFLPIFGLGAKWSGFKKRLFYHNILRTYLDYEVIPTLPEQMATMLSATTPTDWLPFVPDERLVAWQEMLTRQLRPGAKIETVAVFAERQGISEADYNAIVNSEEEMAAKIFTRVSRQELIEYRKSLIEANVVLLIDYLKGI